MSAVEVIRDTALVDAGDIDDELIIRTWLRSHTPNTAKAYAGDIARFVAIVGKPLRAVTASDLQDFSDTLVRADGEPYAPASKARIIHAVKSLLSFCRRQGYIPFDIGEVVKVPTIPNELAQRILPESDVQRMIALEPDDRNSVLLRLLYASGGRASEVASLRWSDLSPAHDAGQLTLYGKGGKTRMVLLSADTWNKLIALRLRGDAGSEDPVFRSRNGGPLTSRQIGRIVKAAAERAGIENAADVSPHWLRHAHASHALDRGAPIHLVQATLGHASVATTGRYLHARPSDSSSRYLGV